MRCICNETWCCRECDSDKPNLCCGTTWECTYGHCDHPCCVEGIRKEKAEEERHKWNKYGTPTSQGTAGGEIYFFHMLTGENIHLPGSDRRVFPNINTQYYFVEVAKAIGWPKVRAQLKQMEVVAAGITV